MIASRQAPQRAMADQSRQPFSVASSMVARIAIAVAAVMRGIPAHRERHAFAGPDRELADRRQLRCAVQRHRRDELHRVRSRHRARAAEMRAHPRNAARRNRSAARSRCASGRGPCRRRRGGSGRPGLAFLRSGMKSMIVAAPSAVSKRVSRCRFRRDSARERPRSGSCRREQPAPVLRLAEQRRETDSESKRGRHSQSIDPPRDTSAAV